MSPLLVTKRVVAGGRTQWMSVGLCALALAFAVCKWSGRDGRQQYANLGNCSLANGGTIYDCRVGFRTWGRLNHERSNAILVPTWFAGSSRDIAGLVGRSRMLDSSRYFILAVDSLGDGVSSSPSNSRPQHGTSFPAFTISDMVETDHRLLTESLHLSHLYAVVGFSMGGMQAFEWFASRPSFITKAIAIEGSPRLADSDLALWRSEEAAMQNDPAFLNGYYSQAPAMIGVMDIHNRFLTAHPEQVSPTAAKYRMPFDANDWRAQEEAMIHLDATREMSAGSSAASQRAQLLVIVNKQDKMVAPSQAEKFARDSHARLLVLDSDCGHLLLTCEMPRIVEEVRSFLAITEQPVKVVRWSDGTNVTKHLAPVN
jgi:homoserine O-acetyltransferase